MTRIELAKRIIDLDYYEAKDVDETPETVAETIESSPETVIEYLINFIEDLL